MKVSFDQGVPVPLRSQLQAHSVETAHERGWSLLKNGELIGTAEAEGFEVFVTTGQNLKYQQNLEERRIAVVVLLSTSWPRIQRAIPDVVAMIEGAKAVNYIEVPIP